VRGPSRARPGGEGPCSLPLAARHSRQRYGRDTRARRCAARAGWDPAGRDPAPSLSLLGTADSVMAATHAQGGARPELGVTRRGGTVTLLPPSRCSAQPTASWPRHTHKAVRGPSRARPDGKGPCSLPSRCSAQPTATWPQHPHRRCAARSGRAAGAALARLAALAPDGAAALAAPRLHAGAATSSSAPHHYTRVPVRRSWPPYHPPGGTALARSPLAPWCWACQTDLARNRRRRLNPSAGWSSLRSRPIADPTVVLSATRPAPRLRARAGSVWHGPVRHRGGPVRSTPERTIPFFP